MEAWPRLRPGPEPGPPWTPRSPAQSRSRWRRPDREPGASIWKLEPHHLDKTQARRFRTLRYILVVYTGTSVLILTCASLSIYQYIMIPNRNGIYLYILYHTGRNDGFSIVGALLSCRIMQVYTSHVQHNTSWCFKCIFIYPENFLNLSLQDCCKWKETPHNSKLESSRLVWLHLSSSWF
jgi:hypothetical protein